MIFTYLFIFNNIFNDQYLNKAQMYVVKTFFTRIFYTALLYYNVWIHHDGTQLYKSYSQYRWALDCQVIFVSFKCIIFTSIWTRVCYLYGFLQCTIYIHTYVRSYTHKLFWHCLLWIYISILRTCIHTFIFLFSFKNTISYITYSYILNIYLYASISYIYDFRLSVNEWFLRLYGCII